MHACRRPSVGAPLPFEIRTLPLIGAISVLARCGFQQHTELVHAALSFRACLWWHHPHQLRGRGDVMAGPYGKNCMPCSSCRIWFLTVLALPLAPRMVRFAHLLCSIGAFAHSRCQLHGPSPVQATAPRMCADHLIMFTRYFKKYCVILNT